MKRVFEKLNEIIPNCEKWVQSSVDSPENLFVRKLFRVSINESLVKISSHWNKTNAKSLIIKYANLGEKET